jgi:SP family sugar:H+ symporter-like MFS transporter
MTIMQRFYRKRATTEDVHEKGTPNTHSPEDTPPRSNSEVVQAADLAPTKVPAIAVVLGAVASIGGFMFGYESGQISGFLEMSDFKNRFGENDEFTAVRSGAIVGLLA